ncbi:CBS domain-containing protein [Ahniella affigens]|uniref:CBS domain-containing protein n=1 Tax=Ahniella affigens TaxID=2021234 RepID=A0A2P1PTJ9_9GAMM|nr:CBS domain-containing protein [Ahniella affigens]AVP98169.1 CBS domain-containing protein [Ahniella affigens]
MRIKDACTRHVICIPQHQTVRAAARLMQAKYVGALIVVDADADALVPIGILTDSDIVKAVVANHANPDSTAVAEIMTAVVVTCQDESDLKEAIQIMAFHGIRRLPVVDEYGHLTGIVAVDDVYGALVDSLQSLTQAFSPE